MRRISEKVKKELVADPRMKVCAREDEGNCEGRITWEHALIYGGSQIDEAWAILGICEFHHAVNRHQDGKGMNKEKHEWLALRQAPPEAREKYPRINWDQRLKYLNQKYG